MQSQPQEHNVVHNNTNNSENNNWMSNNEIGEGKSSSGEFNQNNLIYKKNNILYKYLIFNKTYMLRKDLSEYFMFWKWLWEFRNMTSSSKEFFSEWIDMIYSYCDESGFTVSKWMIKRYFNPIIEKVKKIEWDNLPQDIISQIWIEIAKCDDTIEIECQSKFIYELYSPYQDLWLLIDKPDTIIKNYEKLNNIERDDRTNTCKALVYLLPTASVFHLMRVIESLTYRYCSILWIKQIEKDWRKEWMWDILNRLKENKNTIPKKKKLLYSEEIIDELVSIKSLYRNPTSHPTKIYTDEEANRLFNRAKSVIDWLLEKL